MNNIIYRRAVPEDAQVLKELAPLVFFKRETIGNALGLSPSPASIAVPIGLIVRATVESSSGISIVAVDPNYKGNSRGIVGFVLTRPLSSPDPTGDISQFVGSRMFPIMEAIEHIHVETEKAFPGFHDRKNVAYGEIFGVAEEVLMHGVAKELMAVVGTELLKAGFPKAVIVTSNDVFIKVVTGVWPAQVIYSMELDELEVGGAKVFTKVTKAGANNLLQMVEIDLAKGGIRAKL